MIILPIGHEESSVRRLPWVTLGIMGLCVAVLLSADPVAPPAEARVPEGLEAAADYWREHPYLDAEPFLIEVALRDLSPHERAVYGEWIVEAGRQTRPPRQLVEVEQQELERLLAIGVAAARANPDGAELNLFQRHGFTPARPGWLALLTHAFVHAGWLHLVSNLFILFLAGPPIEDRWGRPLFTLFCALSAAASALCHGIMTTQPDLPLVGASGAIAGVMGACLVRYWSSSIRFAYFFAFGIRGTFWAPTWLMLPLWFASEVMMAWLTDDLGGGGVAYWAHVGGFAVGVGLALGVRSLGIEERFVHPAIESKITVTCNPVIEEALQARADGDAERAYALLARASRSAGDDPDLVAAFWDVAVALGRRGPAARTLIALVEARVRAGEAELAAQLWCEGLDGGLEAQPSPATLVALIPTLRTVGRSDRAKLALDQALASEQLRSTEALAAVEHAREFGREVQLVTARRALELRLDVVRRDRMKRLVAELSGEDTLVREPVVQALEDLSRFSSLKLAEAVPTAIEPEGLCLELAGGRAVRLAYTRIDALAVAAVGGLAAKPVLVLDLLANWSSVDEEILRVVRLRSDAFDPRELLEGEASAVDAFRGVVARLLEATGGQALPDRSGALGQPFSTFPDLTTYERAVLRVG
jgi:membrane associated rhomboid family serine protease